MSVPREDGARRAGGAWYDRGIVIGDARTLLAVDLGLRTGFALYAADGRLRRYASRHYGTPARLRRAAGRVLGQYTDLAWLVIEGGGTLARIWEQAAGRAGVRVLTLYAEDWRSDLLYSRSRRTGRQAKRHADRLARRVIAWSGAPAPTSLRHDAAEAILVGLWGVLRLGWLDGLPGELRGV